MLATCNTCNHMQCKDCLGHDLWQSNNCTNKSCTTAKLTVKFGRTEKRIDVWHGMNLLDLIGQVAE